MRFTILDTEATYRRLLAAPDAAAREQIFRAELVAPFEGVVQAFGGGDSLAMFGQWGMAPEQFGPGGHDAMAALVDALAANDAWGLAAQALAEVQSAFAPVEAGIPLGEVVFGLVLGKLWDGPLQRGYTGFGGVPGYVMTMYSELNDYNLPRLKGTTAHELHHNLRFTLFPFNMFSTTVGDYIIAEGLAEALAAELYGDDMVGFYVTEFDDAELATARRVIGGALDVTGFNPVRGYIFGDVIAESMGLPKAGVPNYAGYAIGYRVVRQYLARTGSNVAQATLLPATEIIAESGFFS